MNVLLGAAIFLFLVKSSYGDLSCSNGLLNVEDFHNYAIATVEPRALHYYDGTALLGFTYQENIKGFNRLRIRPRYMRDVSHRNLSTSVLGHKISVPIGISPHAAQCGAHPDGENGTAKAARDSGTVMILSTYSTLSMEMVAAAAPGGLRWFQIFLFPNRNLTFDMVKRAERAGFKALVLTVDYPLGGIHYSWDSYHFELPEGMSYGNFAMYINGQHKCISLSEAIEPDTNNSWSDLTWLKSITSLPIVLKGIQTAEDAKLAVKYGASAILVSNHGGRQLDGAPATIEVLPEIIRAVGGAIEVYMDSGVRTGADVFKALSLGARAVFYGRPNVWGLSYQGGKGAKCVTEILTRELNITMALAGFKSVTSITHDAVVKEDYYRRFPADSR